MAANDDEIPGHVVRSGVKGHLSHIGVIISHMYTTHTKISRKLLRKVWLHR